MHWPITELYLALIIYQVGPQTTITLSTDSPIAGMTHMYHHTHHTGCDENSLLFLNLPYVHLQISWDYKSNPLLLVILYT
jgi:hypothetical protein